MSTGVVVREIPDISQGGFLRVLDEASARLSADPPHLCGSTPWVDATGDEPDRPFLFSRLHVQLEGVYRHAISVSGRRVDVELKAGASLYWAPNSYSQRRFDTVGKVFGVAFRPQYLRLMQTLMIGKPIIGETPWFYHTSLPMSGAGTHVLRALNSLAEEDRRGEAARVLFTALLQLVRDHLAADAVGSQVQGRAIRTWKCVEAYLLEHFSRDVNRDSVAKAMGLHPNYLSVLAQRIGGQSFTQTLDEVRINHARKYLLETDLKLERVAVLCGYRDATRLGKVFRHHFAMTPGEFRAQSQRIPNR